MMVIPFRKVHVLDCLLHFADVSAEPDELLGVPDAPVRQDLPVAELDHADLLVLVSLVLALVLVDEVGREGHEDLEVGVLDQHVASVLLLGHQHGGREDLLVGGGMCR